MGKNPIKIGAALKGAVSDLTGEKQFTEFEKVLKKWEESISPEIAPHAQVKGMKKGELLVDVSSTAWAVELSTTSNALLEKINTALGKEKVKKLRFTVNPKSTKEIITPGTQPKNNRQAESKQKD